MKRQFPACCRRSTPDLSESRERSDREERRAAKVVAVAEVQLEAQPPPLSASPLRRLGLAAQLRLPLPLRHFPLRRLSNRC